MIDATEQPIERPKKRQTPYYSGKKKRHVLKTERQVNPQGGIVHLSKSYQGSTHDLRVFKGEKRSPQKKRKPAFCGFGPSRHRAHPFN